MVQSSLARQVQGLQFYISVLHYCDQGELKKKLKALI